MCAVKITGSVIANQTMMVKSVIVALTAILDFQNVLNVDAMVTRITVIKRLEYVATVLMDESDDIVKGKLKKLSHLSLCA